jgi:Alpha/beta hydrolase family
MLEVVDRGSSSESHPVPLLFVHGGEHAAWCWDEHFLDYFAAKGYRALALSLRGHGMSSNSKPPRACSIADYVQDVCSIADHLSPNRGDNRTLAGRLRGAEVSGVPRRACRSAGRINATARRRRGGVTHCWSPVAQDGTASVDHRESHYDGRIVARLQQA